MQNLNRLLIVCHVCVHTCAAIRMAIKYSLCTLAIEQVHKQMLQEGSLYQLITQTLQVGGWLNTGVDSHWIPILPCP